MVLTAVAVLMAACGGDKPDYRSALPGDAMMVVAFQPAQIVAKSGVNAGTMEQSPLYQRLVGQMDASGALSAEEKEYVLSLLAHPEESGIDGERAGYFFLAPAASDEPGFQGGVLLPLDDVAKFTAMVDRINARNGLQTVQEGDLSVVRIGEKDNVTGLCAYNAGAVMCCFGQNSYEALLSYAKARFAAKTSESLMADTALSEFFAGKNDVDMYLSYKELMQLQNQLAAASLPMADVLAGVRMVGSMNFEQGRIVAAGQMLYASKEAEEQMAAFYSYVREQRGSLLKYLPAKGVATLGFGLKGSEFYTTLSQMPGYGMMLANPMVKQVFDAIEGDMAINFAGMLPGGTYPKATLLCEVNDPAVVDNLVAALPGMPVVKSGEGAYSISMAGVTVFFGVKDKVLYATSDAEVKTALDGVKIDALTGQESLFKGHVAAMYFDFVQLNTLLGNYAAISPQMQPLMEVLSLFADMQAWGAEDRGEMVVRMQDRERNALETICSTVSGMMAAALPAEAGNE